MTAGTEGATERDTTGTGIDIDSTGVGSDGGGAVRAGAVRAGANDGGAATTEGWAVADDRCTDAGTAESARVDKRRLGAAGVPRDADSTG